MARKDIFTIEELRAVVDAGYKSILNPDSLWSRNVMETEVGREAYNKYLWNLTDHTQDYFEECIDVAIGDCRYAYEKLDKADDEKRSILDSEINGWIEAAFDEFLF